MEEALKNGLASGAGRFPSFRPARPPVSTTALTTVPGLPTHASLAFLHGTHPPTAHLQHAGTHFPPTYISLCISRRARMRPHSTRPSRLSPSLLPLRARLCFRPLHCDVGHSLGHAVGVVVPRTPGSAVLRAALARHGRARHGRGYHEWPERGQKDHHCHPQGLCVVGGL